MIVRLNCLFLHCGWGIDNLRFIAGEILEKATRVLTDAEKAQMEVEFVGKNGQRRKLEVRTLSRTDSENCR